MKIKIDFYKVISVIFVLAIVIFGVYYVRLNRCSYFQYNKSYYVRVNRLTGAWERAAFGRKWIKINLESKRNGFRSRRNIPEPTDNLLEPPKINLLEPKRNLLEPKKSSKK